MVTQFPGPNPRMRELARPEHVYQLTHPELPGTFAPLRSLDTIPNNLPLELTSFVGRVWEMGELRSIASDTRLVTLTGPGGSGKSRLAALAALAAEDDFAGGVVHLAMTEATTVDQVLAEVALALTGHDSPDGLDGLDSDALVVLDNLESVDGAAALVTDLVERTTGPTLLATSRLPLRIRAEHDVAVPPLSVPATGSTREARTAGSA